MKKWTVLLAFGFILSCATSPHRTSIKIYLQQNNKAKVLSEAKAWVQEEPNNAEAYMWLGFAYAINQDYITATQTFQKAYEMNPNLFTPEEMSKVYKTAAGTAFTLDALITTIRNAAVQLAKENKDAEAIAYMDLALKISPKDPNLYLLKASLEKRANKPEYVETLKAGLQVDPENPDLNYHLGLAYKDQGDYDTALQYLEKAAEMKTDNPDIAFNLGVVYFELEKYNDAITQFQKTLSLDSTRADAWLNLGITAFKVEDYATAQKAFEKYTQLKDTDPQGYHFLAISILDAKGNLEDALKAVDAAIALDPNNPDYYNLKGVILKQLGRTQESLEMFKRAQELEKQK